MKKLLLLLVLMAGAFGVASSQTWTSAPASASEWDAILEGSSSTNTKAPTKWTDTSNELTAEWAFDYNWQNTGVYYTRGKNGIQFGSKNAGIIGMALTTSSFADKKTTTVVVNNAKSNGSAKLSVKVNGVEFKSNSSTAVTLTTTAKDYTFTGSGQGQIEVCFSENGEGKYVGMSGLSVTYEETSVTIGAINAVYETSDGDKEVSGMAQVYTGTKFLFSCENATKISARIGEEVIAANDNGSTVEWISDAREYATVTVEASRGEQIAQPMEFTLISREEPKTLGEVKITYGDGLDVFNNGQYNVVENTEFAFSAENATSIVVTDIDGNELATGTSSTTWKAVAPAFNKRINVEAKRDDQVENKWFFVTVTEAPKPELGEIVVTYGDGKVVSEDSDIKTLVEAGTVFSATAENATHINVMTWAGEEVYDIDGSQISWTMTTPMEEEGVTVTATLGENSKVFMFRLEIVEPENEVWTLVKDTENLGEGGKYIIAYGENAMSTKNETNYRHETGITLMDGNILNPSDEVLRFNLEVSGTSYLWKAVNYLGTNGKLKEGYLYNNENNYLLLGDPQTPANRNTSVSFEGNDAAIKFSKKQLFHCVVNNVSQFRCYNIGATTNGAKPVQIYRLVSTPQLPEFDLREEDATTVAVKATKGELHVVVTEFDANGNEVAEVPVSKIAKAVATGNWLNPVVTDENGVYEIAVPQTAGHYMTIQAKSVLDGYHSEELVKHVDAAGNILSGVDAVMAEDADAPVEYFNMQGMRVEAGQPGIYVRRQGGKVAKVVVR